MKIGIITFHRTKNYGGILQAYALLKSIKDLGLKVEIIDYWPSYRDDFNPNFLQEIKRGGFKKKIKVVLRHLITRKRKSKRNSKINYFLKDYFKIEGKPKYISGEMIPGNYDLCFYGSDQIWRKYKLKSLEGFDETYFGKYPLNCEKKITYAASMGQIEINDSDKIAIKNLLVNFDCIAVRETELKNKLEEDFNLKSHLVCDPTFLLSKHDWLKTANLDKQKKRLCKKKYVLYYNITKSDIGLKIAKQLSKDYNLQIIEMPQPPLMHISGSKNAGTAGVQDFLNFIYYAEYVVSSSFHGVAFSILFEKQFFAVGMQHNSNRAITALKVLNLENRFIRTIDQFKQSDTINYNLVEELLNKYREESLNYLKSSLNIEQKK